MLGVVELSGFQERREAALEAIHHLIDFLDEQNPDELDADFTEGDLGYIWGQLDTVAGVLDRLSIPAVSADIKLAEMGLAELEEEAEGSLVLSTLDEIMNSEDQD